MPKKRALPSSRHLGSRGLAVTLGLLATAPALIGCRHQPSPPLVECVLSYGGESHTTVVRPTSEPYRINALKIEDAFEFKAVYVALPANVAALNFYTYYVSERGPVIAEQTKYRPPFPKNSPGSNGNFTGTRYVYGPDGEELVYSCHWRSP